MSFACIECDWTDEGPDHPGTCPACGCAYLESPEEPTGCHWGAFGE